MVGDGDLNPDLRPNSGCQRAITSCAAILRSGVSPAGPECADERREASGDNGFGISSHQMVIPMAKAACCRRWSMINNSVSQIVVSSNVVC